jgi:GDP-mannose 6-dehydrogenase
MNSATNANARVAVLGLGYVGSVSAACLASLGHRVVGVDKDEHKVRAIQNKRAPFYEPGLQELIETTVTSGRLSASVSLTEALGEAEIALICVGTPSERNGNLGLGQLHAICAEIAEVSQNRFEPLIVAIRSTVFPGTCEETAQTAFRGMRHITVVSNPEFLREGAAVKDFLEPSLMVIGADDPAIARKVSDLYAPLGAETCIVSLRTAEMIKYACNAFHALKIAFANEIGAVATELGVSGTEVMETLCRDMRLNISPAYLKPGFAFGGSCLPKDLRAIVYRASRLDLSLPLLESVLPSNDAHLRRAIRLVLDLPASRIGIFGLAFKENTDDLRESPIVTLVEHMIGKGRELRIFDPHIQLDQIYGSNKNFILRTVPHIGKLLQSRFEDILDWAEYVVVAQKLLPEYRTIIEDSGVPLVDLTAAGNRTAQAITDIA